MSETTPLINKNLTSSNQDNQTTDIGYENVKNEFLGDDHTTLKDEELQSRQKTSGTLRTGINMLKTFMGSGILGLPFAYAQGGLIASTLVMIFLSIISAHTMFLLVQSKEILVNDQKKTYIVTYGDVANECLGQIGVYYVNAVLVFTQFGFCCVYVVFVATNSTQFISWEYNTMVYVWFPIFVALSWIRTLKKLSLVSAASIAVILVSELIILIASFINIYDIIKVPTIDWNIEVWVIWKSFAVMLGVGIYAFDGIGVILPCESAHNNPSTFHLTLMITLLIASLNYIFFGLIPYLAFGEKTCDLITSNLYNFAKESSHPLIWGFFSNAVSVGLILAMVGTFPLQLFVVTDLFEEWLFRDGRVSNNHRMMKENIVRTSLVVGASLVAIVIPNFGSLIGLIGSIGSSSLQFIIPSLFMLKLSSHHNNYLLIFILLFYVVFGIFSGVLGTYQTITELIYPSNVVCNFD